MGSTLSEVQRWDRLESEALALLDFVQNARRAGIEVPFNVGNAFAGVEEALLQTPSAKVAAKLAAAIKMFRDMPEAWRQKICRGWSLPAQYLGGDEAMAETAQTYATERFLVIETRRGGAPEAFHEFRSGFICDGAASVLIREGSSQQEAMQAVLAVYLKLATEWPALIDHRQCKHNGVIFADADGHPTNSAEVFDALIAATEPAPAPQWLTVAATAARLGKSERQVKALCAKEWKGLGLARLERIDGRAVWSIRADAVDVPLEPASTPPGRSRDFAREAAAERAVVNRRRAKEKSGAGSTLPYPALAGAWMSQGDGPCAA